MEGSTDESQFETESRIRGYHEYKAIGTAAVRETLGCVREPANAIDRQTVAVIRNKPVVLHLPKISRVGYFF